MTGRPRILFLAEGATMAHFVRPLALATAVDPARYEVHFYAPERFSHHLRGAAFATGVLAAAPGEQFLANLAKGKPLFSAGTVRSYVKDDQELIRKIRPDLVIGDMRPSLPISARLENAPCAVIINAYWSPYAKKRFVVPCLPVTKLLPPRYFAALYRLSEPAVNAIHVAEMNKARKESGVPALAGDLRDMYTEGDYVLYADVPEFIPTPNAPKTHRYVGICDWNPRTSKPDWWEPMCSDQRQKVFVSLGSSGPLHVLPALLKALSALPVAVVLSTSGRNTGATGAPYEAGLLPFTETAAAASVVVSHGGSGGLYPAIAAGTPVLGIPSNADQHLSTSVLEESGAGLGVRADAAGEKTLHQALRKLLFEPRYRAAAQKWAAIYARYDSGQLFRKFLDDVLGG